MQNEVTISVQPREAAGSGAARRMRRSNRVPAVVYGGGGDPVGIDVDPRAIEAVLSSDRGVRSLIQLSLAGKDLRRVVMIKQTQRHPATENLLHVDFIRVDLDKKIDIDVPVELVGQAEGVKNEGGLVEHVTREVRVRVLPTQIPDSLELDISALHIGQHLEAKDIELPDGMELVSPPTETVLTVVAKPTAVEETVAEEVEGEEAEAAEAAEGEAAEGEQEQAPEKEGS